MILTRLHCYIPKQRVTSNVLSYYSGHGTGYNKWYSQSSSETSKTRIGCASGFWGDTAVSASQLVHKGNINFLVFDYLSEITMSLLTAAKQKMPEFGYAPDFVQAAMAPNLAHIKKKGIRVVSNAGGINPSACATALKEAASKSGVDLNIAVVTGDDLYGDLQNISNLGIKDVNSGVDFPKTITSMTAYLGAGAIARALDLGADVVITGRCTDSALALGPLIHQFKWETDNYDLMAAGSLAGHLIECGAQVTGGVFTDWHMVPDWYNIGFPIVECSPNGDFVVTKPPGTGGLVSPATCSEQLLYEIGDPQNYMLPDVNCDFTNVNFTEQGENSVLVTGVRGNPPTSDYKICSTYSDGYRLTAVFPVVGPRAADKGRRTADEIIKRVRGIYKMLKMDDFTDVLTQVIGAEDTYGDGAGQQGPREVVVWVAVHHKDKRALNLLARELAPAGTGMAPGLTGIAGGRPKVSPVMKLFSFLYPKDKVKVQIHMDGKTEEYTPLIKHKPSDHHTKPVPEQSSQNLLRGNKTYRLEDLAYTRSGDKGNHANIGVVARHPNLVPYLREALTPEAVDSYMTHLFEDGTGPVENRVLRYELPGIHGFNFLLKNSLGGGGVSSLRFDPQGKAYGQMLLDFTIPNMPELDQIL